MYISIITATVWVTNHCFVLKPPVCKCSSGACICLV